MNEQVERLIEKKKQELREKELEERREHLARIGLFDEIHGKVLSNDDPDRLRGTYNEKLKVFYSGKLVPLDVSDEEYAEICKYFPPSETGSPKEYREDAKRLKKISSIVFKIQTVATILLIISSFVDGFTPGYLIIAIANALIAASQWALFNVIANISLRLNERK